MGITTYIIFLAVLYIGYFIYFKFFNKKENKIEVKLYEKIGDKLYLKTTKKKIIAKIKQINGINKLILPKRYSPTHLSPPDPSYYIPNTLGKKMVNLVKLGEGNFVYIELNHEIKGETIKQKIDLLNGDISFWAINEKQHIATLNNKVDKWSWLKQNIALVGAMMISFMIVVYVINWSGDQMETTREDTKTIMAKLETISKNVVGISDQETPKETVETTTDLPPARQTATG